MNSTELKQLRKELFDYMEDHDDNDAPDGSWEAQLEDAVRTFNDAHNTSFDPFESFLWYTRKKSKQDM